MDWKEEYEKVINYEDKYFKPEAGSYNVVVLGEPTKGEYKDKNGDVKDQIVLPIEVNKKMYDWTITTYIGKDSLYSQLIRLLADNNYQWAGLLVQLLVTGKERNKRYTIIETSQ